MARNWAKDLTLIDQGNKESQGTYMVGFRLLFSLTTFNRMRIKPFIALGIHTLSRVKQPQPLFSTAEMGTASSSEGESTSAKSIFDFSVEDKNGEQVSLAAFKGKKAYIVTNVASQ